MEAIERDDGSGIVDAFVGDVCVCQFKSRDHADLFWPWIAMKMMDHGMPGDSAISDGQDIGFFEAVAQYERRMLIGALKATGGNRTQAARQLKMKRTTLIEKLKRFNLLYEDLLA